MSRRPNRPNFRPMNAPQPGAQRPPEPKARPQHYRYGRHWCRYPYWDYDYYDDYDYDWGYNDYDDYYDSDWDSSYSAYTQGLREGRLQGLKMAENRWKEKGYPTEPAPEPAPMPPPTEG